MIFFLLAANASMATAFVEAEIAPARSFGPGGIKNLTLEELMLLEVSTVSRKTEQWWTAPGAVDVITSEDIRRSGALSLPDVLRLGSGVHVTQPAARTWGIGIRGFNVPGGNKINVQFDGRSAFTPFYSGVFWDAQDTLLADVDRIEIVRGPVGALWGSYAVNGFIQVLSKPAWETQGLLSSVAVSTENAHVANVRYGGKLGDDQFLRVYAQYRALEPTYIRGEPRDAASDFFQSGFRMDARADSDLTVTFQGDAYTNKDLFRDGVRDEVTGANVMGRVLRLLSFDSEAQLSSYYDFTDRNFLGGLRETRHTVQVNGQYRVSSFRHGLQIGAEGMFSSDKIGSGAGLQFDPDRRRVYNLGAFANHSIRWIPDRVSTTVGVKIENSTFSDFEYQPTARVSWTPSRKTTVWGAVSRAVRPPVRLDEDLVIPGVFTATDEFESEEVVAYEIGFRHKPSDVLALDLALFKNDYDHLRAYQPRGNTFLPLTFRNMLNAETHGAELTTLYQPASWLLVKASYRYFDIDFSEDPGSQNPFGTRFESNDPRHLGTVAVRVDLPADLEFDITVRHVGSLPWVNTKGYTTADIRIGWTRWKNWDLSLIGRNLLDPYHVESIIPQETSGPGGEVARSLAVRATWRH